MKICLAKWEKKSVLDYLFIAACNFFFQCLASSIRVESRSWFSEQNKFRTHGNDILPGKPLYIWLFRNDSSHLRVFSTQSRDVTITCAAVNTYLIHMCMRRVYTILAGEFIYSSVLIHKFNRKFGGNGFETTDKFRPITSFVCLFVCLFVRTCDHVCDVCVCIILILWPMSMSNRVYFCRNFFMWLTKSISTSTS